MAITNKTLQLKRKASNYASLEATLSAMSGATIAEGEAFVGYYQEGGVDHAVLGIGGINGTPKLFFFDGKEIESKIEAAVSTLENQLVDGASSSANTLSKLEGLINDLDKAAATYTIVSADTSGLGSNVKEAYQLQQTVNGTTTTVGETIKIYKDSSLYSVYLGHVDDTLTSSTNPTVVPGTGSEAMCFIYQKADGTYELVAVDIEDFLNEAEFKDGLQVVNHEVSVKLDNTADSDSAKFLYMKPGSGNENGSIALSGITEAIEAAVNGLDAVKSGSTAHVSVKVTEADGVITDVTVTEEDIASAAALANEAAYRKAVTGINGDAYTANTGTTYISAATDINDATVKLDAAVAALDAAQISIEKGASSDAFLDITKSGTVYTITVSGVSAAITSAIEALDVEDSAVANQFVTSVSESDGKVSVTRAQVAASGVTANAITGDTFEVTGTTVQAQLEEIVAEVSDMQDGAYSGVTAGDGITVTPQTNGDKVEVKLTNTGVTADLLSFNSTTHAIEFSDTFDCGSW